MNKLNKSIAFRHLKKYSQYTQNQNWLTWYSKVAPLKGERTAKILLNYKDSKAKLLDLGCGIGLTLAVLAKHFTNSMGCDVGKNEIRASKELLKLLEIKSPVVLYDGKHLPFKDNTFDIITSIEVIEHVSKPDLMLKEIRRVLKPGGILHITTANKWWPIEPHFKLPFLSYLPSGVADFYVRVFRRGNSYQGIHLPGYGKFYKIVDKYFTVTNITLDIIRDFEHYGLDKERGRLIIMVGRILKFAGHYKKTLIVGGIISFVEKLLIKLSLGWLFIAYPKKIK